MTKVEQFKEELGKLIAKYDAMLCPETDYERQNTYIELAVNVSNKTIDDNDKLIMKTAILFAEDF